jgi:prevent-host-death family protein
MAKKSQTVGAGEFKARCLALLDEVATLGTEIVVTKRGKPVARLVPTEGADKPTLKGSVTYHGDIVAPFFEEWGEDE